MTIIHGDAAPAPSSNADTKAWLGYLSQKRAECLTGVELAFDVLTSELDAGEPGAIVAAKLFAADEANGLIAALANLLVPFWAASQGVQANCVQLSLSYSRAAAIDRLAAAVPADGPAMAPCR